MNTALTIFQIFRKRRIYLFKMFKVYVFCQKTTLWQFYKADFLIE